MSKSESVRVYNKNGEDNKIDEEILSDYSVNEELVDICETVDNPEHVGESFVEKNSDKKKQVIELDKILSDLAAGIENSFRVGKGVKRAAEDNGGHIWNRRCLCKPSTSKMSEQLVDQPAAIANDATECEKGETLSLTAYPGSRAVISEALVRRGTPRSAIDIMLSSLSIFTLKKYDYTFKLWWQYCYKLNSDPYDVSVSFVLDFLTERFESGASYATLESDRSALAIIIETKLENDDRVQRFFKEVSRSQLRTTILNEVRNKEMVLNHLESHYPNETLDLHRATKKLVTLLAITGHHKVKTFSLLKLNNIKYTTKGAEILTTEVIKMSKKCLARPKVCLRRNNFKPQICPVAVLNMYLKITEPLRRYTENLFLTLKEPYRSAKTNTISQWIKSTIMEAGVDPSTFYAHAHNTKTCKSFCCA